MGWWFGAENLFIIFISPQCVLECWWLSVLPSLFFKLWAKSLVKLRIVIFITKLWLLINSVLCWVFFCLMNSVSLSIHSFSLDNFDKFSHHMANLLETLFPLCWYDAYRSFFAGWCSWVWCDATVYRSKKTAIGFISAMSR